MFDMTTFKLKPPAKARIRDPESRRVSSNWYRWSRNLLDMTREEIAPLIGCSPTAYWTWETGKASAPTEAYLLICGLLAEQGFDSKGRILAAKVTG